MSLKFQVLDWDEQLTVDGEPAKEYIIRLFGRTSDDKTICCTIDD